MGRPNHTANVGISQRGFGIATSCFQTITDNGYTRYCLVCACRHGPVPEMIGKERPLVAEACGPCREKGKKIPAPAREVRTKEEEILLLDL